MRLIKPAVLVLSKEDLLQAVEYWMDDHMRVSYKMDTYKPLSITLSHAQARITFHHPPLELKKNAPQT